MKLSVIIPLYNNAQYLQACIDSLALQGIGHSEFEIIIVDDGSTDGSAEMADDIAGQWDNVQVIHQPNSGSGVARNIGMDICCGEYIHFVDADDQVMPGAYRYLFDHTLTTSPDIVYFDFGENCYTRDYTIEGKITYRGGIRDFVKDYHIRPNVWLKLYRKGYLQKHNLRLPSLRTRQDLVFTWDMMRYDGTMIVSNAKLYSYTINRKGVTYSRDPQHVKRTVYTLVTVNEMLKEYSRDYVGYWDATRVRTYNYKVLFNRILCTHFSLRELRALFPRCARIGTTHIYTSRFYHTIDFLYHHPLFYFTFQKLILWYYFRRYPVPATNRGDLIDHRLAEQSSSLSFIQHYRNMTITYIKKLKSDILKPVCLWLLYRLFSFLPLKNKVVTNCFDGVKYGDNPQFIVEKLHQEKPDYQYVWMKKPKYSYHVPEWMTTTPFAISVRSIYHIATAKVFINTNVFMPWIKKREGQLFIETWHGGLGIKRIMNDSVWFSADKQAKQNLEHTVRVSDVFISQSDHLTNIYRRAFGYEGPVFKCGYPKNDQLLIGKEIARQKIRDYYNIDQNTRIFLYAPTFRDYSWNRRLPKEVYDLDFVRLHQTLTSTFGGRWKILVRWHPIFSDDQKRLTPITDDVINASLYPDMQELLKACDAVMTDYSSCIFDAALLDMPCFTYAIDFEEYKAERGVYYEMEELPFPYARNDDELMANIANYDHQAYLERWYRFKQRMGLYEPGNASEVIAHKIIEFIETRTTDWK